MNKEEIDYRVEMTFDMRDLEKVIEFRANKMNLKDNSEYRDVLEQSVYFDAFQMWLESCECHGDEYNDEDFFPFIADYVSKMFYVSWIQQFEILTKYKC